MTIILERCLYLPKRTIGVLKYGDFRVFSLELPFLNNQRNISCIPCGEYIVQRYSSQKFEKAIEILNVPNRENILIHPLNYINNIINGELKTESKGCIGIGYGLNEDLSLIESKKAINRLYDLIEKPTKLIIL